MTHFSKPLSTRRAAPWVAAAAALTLAGCAVPYPVHEPQPAVVQQPVVVQSSPSRSEQRRDYRRRQNETLYEAEVVSVRAVMGPPEQRCWIEREQLVQQRPDIHIGGALLGAVVGGVVGHQIGGGTGQDIATAGGAVAGAFIGSNIARDRFGNPVATQDVQRCSNVSGRSEPAYWDVTYRFDGNMHHAQMTSQPGRYITVNRDGEPRE